MGCFKKLTDKTCLLDEAIKLGDGDVVTAVLLFLQKSLHQSVLFSILRERQVAAEQYIDILEKQNCYEEAATLCTDMQQPREAALHLYNNTLRGNKKTLLPMLEKLHKCEFRNLARVEMETEILNEHIHLLRRQIPIASEHSIPHTEELEKTKLSPFVGPPVLHDALVGSSLLATLQYCCRFHWSASENLITSPVALKKSFPLTDRQFTWNAYLGKLLSGNDPIPVLLAKVSLNIIN